MTRTFTFLLVIFWVAVSWAATEGYDYPFDDRFVATVIGTPSKYRAELPKKIPIKQRAITIFEDRKIPDSLWYDEKLRYSYALQKAPAPLVFLIAGTGGYHGGAKNKMMGRAFYQAGFHVVSLSSPTHPNFIVAASKTAVPGHAYRDAEDLYRVMQKVWDAIRKKATVTDFYVTGYSLGGFNSAFVAWLDEQRKIFNFRKALLINPPVKLYNSVSILDRMLENIPGGEDNFSQFYGKLVKQFSEVYKRSDRLDMNEDMLYQAYEALNIEDESMAALIGVSFRISSANLTLVSDIMTDY
ncbi:MAG: alpha/beta hydrolase, partial [Gammaproteobacteria bacterium]